MEPLPKVSFCRAIKTNFANYTNFSGRSRRSEYWNFVIPVNCLTLLFLGFTIFFVCGGGGYYKYYGDSYYYHSYYHYNEEGILAFIIITCTFVSFIMIPIFAATVRRLHDIGKRGEYIFVGLAPFFGGITLLVLLCMDSQKESNEFGPSPKYMTTDKNELMLINSDKLTPN